MGSAVMLVAALVGSALPTSAVTSPRPVPSVVETVPGLHTGDSMDDPAIWVHPDDPSRSLVVANDKQGALEVFDLAGQRVQRIAAEGRFFGNVDVRQGVAVGGFDGDLVTFTHDGLRAYTVDPATRQLLPVHEGGGVGGSGEGHCLFADRDAGVVYAFQITIQGVLRQYALGDPDGDGLVSTELVRQFAIGSEAEGCVVNDVTGDLFVSEEDRGIWRYGAQPTAGTTREAVALLSDADNELAPDIEGLTLATNTDGQGYLIASSQNVANGSASYFTVFRATGDHAFVENVRVVDGAGSDDCDRTDGIAAHVGALGPAFPTGLFVCQDNSNARPGTTGNQNLKLVPLDDVVDLEHTGNAPPVPRLEFSCTDLACEFDARGSGDADGLIRSYDWDLGDGSSATGPQVSHAYAEDGTYTVRLQVVDDDGATASLTRSVSVTGPSQPVSFVGQRTSPNLSQQVYTSAIPTEVVAGDGLLLVLSRANQAVTTTGPAGWTLVGSAVDAEHVTTVWSRVASVGDTGQVVSVTASARDKGVLTVAAYRGTHPSNPVADWAAAAQPNLSTTVTTPVRPNPFAEARRVSLWSMKTGSASLLRPPTSETQRAASVGTGSGRVLLTLSDAASGAGTTTGGVGATTNASTAKATAWTLLLRPAPVS